MSASAHVRDTVRDSWHHAAELYYVTSEHVSGHICSTLLLSCRQAHQVQVFCNFVYYFTIGHSHQHSMSDGPLPNANPHIDSHSQLLLAQAARLSKGQELSQLSISDARSLFDKLQAPAPAHPDIKISKTEVKTSHGHVDTFIFKSEPDSIQPYMFYVHGGAFFFGNVTDFYPLIFDLVRRAECALVFPQYTLAPESKFPVQQEQCLEILQQVAQGPIGNKYGLSNERIVVLGDSAGG